MTQNEISYRQMLMTNRRETDRNRETERHNRVTEVESERTNRANEVLQVVRNAESERHNRADEVIRQVQNAENERAHRAQESINVTLRDEEIRANKAKEAENYRHNTRSEQTELAKQAIQLVRHGGSASGEFGGGVQIGPLKFSAGTKYTGPTIDYQTAMALLNGTASGMQSDSIVPSSQGNNLRQADHQWDVPLTEADAHQSGFTINLGIPDDGTNPNHVLMSNPQTGQVALVDKNTGAIIKIRK